MNIVLKKTCDACPEQYDAINTETFEVVGYLRLRHGWFYTSCPDVDGDIVYESYPDGDGAFFDDQEREVELKNAIEAIRRYYE